MGENNLQRKQWQRINLKNIQTLVQLNIKKQTQPKNGHKS